MSTTFYRIWLPASLLAHGVLFLLLRSLPLSAPVIGGDHVLPVSIVAVLEPPPAEPPMRIAPPVVATPPPIVTPPARHMVVDAGNPHSTLKIGPTRDTGSGNIRLGAGDAEKGKAGAQPAAPPDIMRAPGGGNPPAPSGRAGGTGNLGTELGPGGPSTGARAKHGRQEGSSKLAGEINASAVALFTVTVDPAGNTRIDLTKSTGNDDLDRLARKLVLDTDYTPALKNGVPVADTVRMRVAFTNGQYVIEELTS